MIETFLIEAAKAVVWMAVGLIAGLLIGAHRRDPLDDMADAPCSDYDVKR